VTRSPTGSRAQLLHARGEPLHLRRLRRLEPFADRDYVYVWALAGGRGLMTGHVQSSAILGERQQRYAWSALLSCARMCV
jgi:hypothetical protein